MNRVFMCNLTNELFEGHPISCIEYNKDPLNGFLEVIPKGPLLGYALFQNDELRFLLSYAQLNINYEDLGEL